jgi:bifunctional DNA-binding transcriptional regulator/antitoxin component of YhaV-PrlF toxin-antitoxin module
MITAKLSVNDMTRIPKQVRQDLKLIQGDRIVFEKRGEEYFIRKLVEESLGVRRNAINSWRSDSDYQVGDMVLGSDERIYRLKRIGWQFLDPTSSDGKNSWESA